MNITLSADDGVVAKVRELARRQGTSLNAMIRAYLESLAGHASGDVAAQEYLELTREHPGASGEERFRREDAYEGRS